MELARRTFGAGVAALIAASAIRPAQAQTQQESACSK
jgi:hypothetical protein